MIWTIIDEKTTEPDTEVLAIGYQDECLIGYCTKSYSGKWECESGIEVLTDVVAFIPTKYLVNLYKNSHPHA